MCSRAIFGELFSCFYVFVVTAVRRVVASSSITQSLKGIATAGAYNTFSSHIKLSLMLNHTIVVML